MLVVSSVGSLSHTQVRRRSHQAMVCMHCPKLPNMSKCKVAVDTCLSERDPEAAILDPQVKIPVPDKAR